MAKEKGKKNVVWDFIDKHPNFIYCVLITIIAVVVRFVMIKHNSGDYDMFLKPWFDELKLYGGLGGLARDIGNYTPVYMTILALLTYIPIDSVITIKIVSIIFDFIGAYVAMEIVKELLRDNKHATKMGLLIYACYLFLPTVVLNSSFWAQSDGIYTAFVLISIYYLIKGGYKRAILFWSIALSFKFQAIFIFPLYVLMYISERKMKLRYLLIIPATIFVLSIPKAIYSNDFLVGFRVYFNQAGTYSQYITLNFPNVYGIFFGEKGNNLINMPFEELNIIGILVTFVILITLAYLVYTKKIKFDKNAVIEFGLFSILLTVFFLPQMHERYMFMGDVIALLYLVINSKKTYIPLMIEFISLNGYMYLLFAGFAINFSLLSIAFLVLIVLYTKDMYNKYLKQ